MRIGLVSIVFAALLPALAVAEETPVSFELLHGWQTADGRHMAAFRLSLAPGWKTYWRSPGDAGVPPTVDWSRSRNLQAAVIHWPRPQVFDTDGLRTVGYKDELILPVELTPIRGGRPITAAGLLSVGVCSDVCIPMDFQFRLKLGNDTAPDAAIVAALSDQPPVRAANALASVACRVDPIDDGLRLSAKLAIESQGAREAVVFEHADPAIWIGQAALTRRGGSIEVSADLVPPEARPFALDRSEIVMTLIGDSGAVEIRGCPAG